MDLLEKVENALQLKNLSKTRWTVRPESIDAVWRSFETVVEALVKTKMMTKVLERETLVITGAIEALKITGESIQRIRKSDTEIDNLVNASVSFASNLKVDAVSEYKKYHRTRRLPRCLDERQNTTAEIELPQFCRK